ncbi:MAG: hypothetical protein GY782_11110 [Gammaproteobacteria bacterium]|nr:hypothetical protein [Gammaproteobacteria bacterium]
MKIALLCGGPSLERGISLNSARSVLDHLAGDDITISPIYFDEQCAAYPISTSTLYCNTPADFDFKLRHQQRPLDEATLVKTLKSADLTLSVIHGAFGEDGEIQAFLQRHDIPFIGSDAAACHLAFDKFRANEHINKKGFFTLPSLLLTQEDGIDIEAIKTFFHQQQIHRAIVKPANGGSSIGVFSVNSAIMAAEKAQRLFNRNMTSRVVIEPFAQGVEFTVIILENADNRPIALLPTEIETDYREHQIFDFRKKYLPSGHVTYHCPPQFDDSTINTICQQAEALFSELGMRDFARFDGWLLNDGNLWFSDFNPISGMEQNSFLFMQAARIGLSHSEVLRYIVAHACQRYHLTPPALTPLSHVEKRITIPILFGGCNAERQVSLMSGTNVWLKLKNSKHYHPQPFFIAPDNTIWQLPYHLALNHTVEEIHSSCQQYEKVASRLDKFEQTARQRLQLPADKLERDFFAPKKVTLETLMQRAEFIFIALHGGEGENGTLQQQLSERNVYFNGVNADAARLCMNKWHTAQAVRKAQIDGITTARGKPIVTEKLLACSAQQLQQQWQQLTAELDSQQLIVKPIADGCSAGVVKLENAAMLSHYLDAVRQCLPHIAASNFQQQSGIIEMPPTPPESLLFEQFIVSDQIEIHQGIINYQRHSGWIELTIGLIEIDKQLRAFQPSITVASGTILTVEEKFQGGTGINITPPPETILSAEVIEKVQRRIEQLAIALNLESYARIDLFVAVDSGDMIIIEINTLPALTPSTVLYHQALAETLPLTPRDLLESLIDEQIKKGESPL